MLPKVKAGSIYRKHIAFKRLIQNHCCLPADYKA